MNMVVKGYETVAGVVAASIILFTTIALVGKIYDANNEDVNSYQEVYEQRFNTSH